MTRPTHGRRLLLLATLLSFGSACTVTWRLRTDAPEAALQWPHAPARPKVTYVASLAGLSGKRGAGLAARDFIVGKDDTDPSAFVLPVAVAAAPDGRMAVADTGRSCVHLYVPADQRYEKLTGTAAAPMLSPVGLAFDAEGQLYASDSTGKVFAFARDGSVRFVLTAAGAAPLQRPTGLAYSPRRRVLYVVDTLASRIHGFDERGEHQLSFGGRGEGEGQLNFPTHASWSPAGEIYVADVLNFRVQIFDEAGGFVGAFGRHGNGSGDLAMPKGVAVDGDGVVYVVDGLFDNVQLFDRSGTFLLTLGRRGTGFGEFWLPSGAFIGGQGQLYVCDTYNHRIQVFRIEPGYGHDAS